MELDFAWPLVLKKQRAIALTEVIPVRRAHTVRWQSDTDTAT